MKNQSKYLMVGVLGLLIAAGPAFAEMIQGQVTAVNTENNSLTVQRMKDTGEQEQINLNVPQNAQFRGISSLQDVEVGDEIKAEANKPSLGLGAWDTKWLSKEAMAGAGRSGSSAMSNTSSSMPSSSAGSTSEMNQGSRAGGSSSY